MGVEAVGADVAAVVGGDDDDRVFEPAGCFEGRDEASELRVELGDAPDRRA